MIDTGFSTPPLVSVNQGSRETLGASWPENLTGYTLSVTRESPALTGKVVLDPVDLPNGKFNIVLMETIVVTPPFESYAFYLRFLSPSGVPRVLGPIRVAVV